MGARMGGECSLAGEASGGLVVVEYARLPEVLMRMVAKVVDESTCPMRQMTKALRLPSERL